MQACQLIFITGFLSHSVRILAHSIHHEEAWQISKLFHLKSISKLYMYIQCMCSKATPLRHVCDMVLSFSSQADKKKIKNFSLETFVRLKQYIPYVMRNVTYFLAKTRKPVWICTAILIEPMFQLFCFQINNGIGDGCSLIFPDEITDAIGKMYPADIKNYVPKSRKVRNQLAAERG